MIFITVGTEKWPFDRLLRAIDSAVERKDIVDEVFAQIGHAKYMPRSFSSERFLDFDKFVDMIDKARIIISHAGAGSIILCLRRGKIPIIYPRDPRFNEHVDDHQMDIARRMAEMGKVLAAYSEDELIEKVGHYKELIGDLKPARILEGRDRLAEYLNSLC